MKIATLVVTYNRKKLLKECLYSILNQSIISDNIFVIDNASNDGTQELFEINGLFYNSKITYIRENYNLGGAGGFYKGIKACYKDYDWIWIMDDDTIPTKKCLEGLIDCVNIFKDEKISFIASSIWGPNGEAMNLPTIDLDPFSNGYSNWYLHLGKGLVKIKTATFVSILINTKAIEKCGLPQSWYFIWGDDTEYTLRLTKNFGPAFFTGNSVAIHKRYNAKQLSIWDENNINRINLYFYFFRNHLLNTKKYYGKKEAIIYMIKLQLLCLKKIFNNNIKYRFKKIRIINKAIRAYLFHNYEEKQIDE